MECWYTLLIPDFNPPSRDVEIVALRVVTLTIATKNKGNENQERGCIKLPFRR